MSAYYNENDPYAAQWLRNLVEAGHIAPGPVDDRSIRDLYPERLSERTQMHFFAGIGAWSYALRLAGVPDELPVWTGSCPCQPFSQAGRRRGTEDERHLWPEWFRLIRACQPPILFGEQVANPDGLAWLDTVLADLEGEGYEVGAADLCAAGVGAPHLRQRLYFVAVARGERREGLRIQLQSGRSRQACAQAARRGAPRLMANYNGLGRNARRTSEACSNGSVQPARFGDACDVAESESGRRGARSGDKRDANGTHTRGSEPRGHVRACGMGDARGEGSGRDSRAVPRAQGAKQGRGLGDRRVADEPEPAGAARELGDASSAGSSERSGAAERLRPLRIEGPAAAQAGVVRGFWGDADLIYCRPSKPGRDGEYRPVEPGTFPLAHGAPARVGRVRAYGNAIVPSVAATFIRAVIDSL